MTTETIEGVECMKIDFEYDKVIPGWSIKGAFDEA